MGMFIYCIDFLSLSIITELILQVIIGIIIYLLFINPLINYHILHLIEDLKEYLNAKIHPITKNQILLLINKLLRKRKILVIYIYHGMNLY